MFYRQTGQVTWKQTALTNRGITGPAIIGNAIVVADAFGYVHFLSKTNGHLLARVQATKNAIVANPMVVGNQVIIYTSRGNLVSYSLSAV